MFTVFATCHSCFFTLTTSPVCKILLLFITCRTSVLNYFSWLSACFSMAFISDWKVTSNFCYMAVECKLFIESLFFHSTIPSQCWCCLAASSAILFIYNLFVTHSQSSRDFLFSDFFFHPIKLLSFCKFWLHCCPSVSLIFFDLVSCQNPLPGFLSSGIAQASANRDIFLISEQSFMNEVTAFQWPLYRRRSATVHRWNCDSFFSRPHPHTGLSLSLCLGHRGLSFHYFVLHGWLLWVALQCSITSALSPWQWHSLPHSASLAGHRSKACSSHGVRLSTGGAHALHHVIYCILTSFLICVT